MYKFWLVVSISCLAVLPVKSQFVLNGQATDLGQGCYQLTYLTTFALGTAWSPNLVDLSEPFDLRFEIFLGCSDGNGADGMVFGLQALSSNAGSAGAGIGFGGIAPSIGIEFDTHTNYNFNDPSFDHTALIINGDVDHTNTNNTLVAPIQLDPNNNDVEDCEYHDVRIIWDPTNFNLKMYFDCNLRIDHNFTTNPITGIFNNDPMVYWGFTSATGGFTNEHRFCLNNNPFTGSSRDTAICKGDSVQLYFSGGVNYSWNTSVGLDDNTSSSPVFYPQTSTQYVVEITDACGDIWYDTANITVENPHVFDLGADTAICDGETVTLDAVNAAGVSYEWSTSATTAQINVGTANIYSVTATKGACITTDNIQVDILDLPSIDFGSETVVCPNQPLILNATAPNGNIVWSNGSSGNSIVVDQPGSYWVTASNPCASISDSISVTAETLPTVELGPLVEICEGELATFDGTVSNAASYSWSNGATSPIQTFDTTGTWTLTVSNVCGSVTDEAEVLFWPSPQIGLPADTVLCLGKSYDLKPRLQFVDSFAWDNGSTDSIYYITESITVSLTAQNLCDTVTKTTNIQEVETVPLYIGADDSICPIERLLIEPELEGFETFLWSNGDESPFTRLPIGKHVLTAVDTNACVASDTIELINYCPEELFAPNAFTPNGDGTNDVFRIVGVNIFQPTLRIFNRWGEEIHTSTSLEQGWDGTKNGTTVQEGIYLWRLDYLRGNRTNQTEMGKVLLFRRR